MKERLRSHLWTFQYQTDMVHSWKEFNIYKIIEKHLEVNDKIKKTLSL